MARIDLILTVFYFGHMNLWYSPGGLFSALLSINFISKQLDILGTEINTWNSDGNQIGYYDIGNSHWLLERDQHLSLELNHPLLCPSVHLCTKNKYLDL